MTVLKDECICDFKIVVYVTCKFIYDCKVLGMCINWVNTCIKARRYWYQHAGNI